MDAAPETASTAPPLCIFGAPPCQLISLDKERSYHIMAAPEGASPRSSPQLLKPKGDARRPGTSNHVQQNLNCPGPAAARAVTSIEMQRRTRLLPGTTHHNLPETYSRAYGSFSFEHLRSRYNANATQHNHAKCTRLMRAFYQYILRHRSNTN